MIDQPKFSEEEWALVVQLLQREHNELPVEIHHCRVNEYRDELHHRQAMVQNLLDRLQVPAIV